MLKQGIKITRMYEQLFPNTAKPKQRHLTGKQTTSKKIDLTNLS
jgi:hypothetical protein